MKQSGIFILAVLGTTAFGQAVVEHAVGTAGAAAAAPGAKGAGSAIGGIFGSLSETVGKASEPAKHEAAAPAPAPEKSTRRTKARAPEIDPSAKTVVLRKPPAMKLIDPSEIHDGLQREELLDRFGEPSMRFSERSSSHLLETYWYNDTPSHSIPVRLVDGKVSLPAPASARSR